MADTYLHTNLVWVYVEGSTTPSKCVLVEGSTSPSKCLSVQASCSPRSQDDSQGDTVAVIHDQEAIQTSEKKCLKPKFEDDQKLILEFCSSNLCNELFVNNLENANPGLLHVETCHNTVNFHFGPDNQLDPIFPTLRLNSSNKNVIQLQQICSYTHVNSYLDKRINQHMKKKGDVGLVMQNAVVDSSKSLCLSADIASLFENEIFTQNRDSAAKHGAGQPHDPTPTRDATTRQDPSPLADVEPPQDPPPSRDASSSQVIPPFCVIQQPQDPSSLRDAAPRQDPTPLDDAAPRQDPSLFRDAAPHQDHITISDAAPSQDHPQVTNATQNQPATNAVVVAEASPKLTSPSRKEAQLQQLESTLSGY